MIRRPPRSTLSSSSAASDVYKRQMPSIGTALLVAGLAALTHAAMATMKYRTELKALDLDFTSAPWSVVAECCLGMVLCVVGCAMSNAKLLPVHAKRECAERPLDVLLGSTSFMSFNHRGRATAAWTSDQ
eukprot:TRINITY_DN10055_c0_g1_i4.p2 TRINITY_DN10055_c0_g1~~TRINITY_DN10055_c0_g1_i4.p2  ORF type:complete len:130 (-),score=37.98 TRINITY_DN10055_c0_g1_i4:445-834(-)